MSPSTSAGLLSNISYCQTKKKSFSRKASNVQGSPDAEETQTGVHKNDLFVPILFSTFIFLGTI